MNLRQWKHRGGNLIPVVPQSETKCANIRVRRTSTGIYLPAVPELRSLTAWQASGEQVSETASLKGANAHAPN